MFVTFDPELSDFLRGILRHLVLYVYFSSIVAHLGDYYKTDKLLASLINLSAHKKIWAVRTESGRPLPRQKGSRGLPQSMSRSRTPQLGAGEHITPEHKILSVNPDEMTDYIPYNHLGD